MPKAPTRFRPTGSTRPVRRVDRPNAAARGYDHGWRKYRRAFLAAHPLCRACERAGEVVAATVVDHIVPHRGDESLFWAESNHQPLCEVCHNRKSQTERLT